MTPKNSTALTAFLSIKKPMMEDAYSFKHNQYQTLNKQQIGHHNLHKHRRKLKLQLKSSQ
jgi:hypothetical protein